MRSLGKWQFISFFSRIMASVPGWVQSFIYIGLLSKSDWGTLKHALAIGAALGIFQHLGLASASTREISAAKDDEHIIKIFITSAFIRYLVTIPIALFLIFGADHMATQMYKNLSLALPLKLYGVVLFFQGAQSILNSVISGTQRFKRLFIYQVVIAYVSLAVFIPFVYFLKLPGYFYGMIVFNIISTLSLFVLAFKPLKAKLVFPNKKEFVGLFKELFSISIAIYIVKIIYTNWEGLGNNLVGMYVTPEILASFSLALLYSKKLMNISDSVTDVSLPVFSEKFVKDFEDFKVSFVHNFNKLFALIVTTGVFAAYWVREISFILIGLLVGFITGKNRFYEYMDAFPIAFPLIMAFIMYSFINIVKSSILIPAKMVRHMIFSFVVLILVTLGFYYASVSTLGYLNAISWGMALGASASFALMCILINKSLKYNFFTIDHLVILIQAAFICWIGRVDNVLIKSIAFVPFFGLLIGSYFTAQYLVLDDIKSIVNKFLRKFKIPKVWN